MRVGQDFGLKEVLVFNEINLVLGSGREDVCRFALVTMLLSDGFSLHAALLRAFNTLFQYTLSSITKFQGVLRGPDHNRGVAAPAACGEGGQDGSG